MKNIPIFTLLLLSSLLSCSKDSRNPDTWGELKALKNDQPWSGAPLCIANKPHKQGLDIDVTLSNAQGFERESLTFLKIPDAVGTYPLNKTEVQTLDSLHGVSYATLLDDGDVLGDFYDLLEGVFENNISISKKDGDELWGTFQVALVKNTSLGENDPSAPDTVLFRDGCFHVRIRR